VRRPKKRDESLRDVTAHPPETQGRAGERTHFPAEQLECVTRDGPPPGQKKHPLLHGYPNMPRRKSKKTKPTVAGILGLGLDGEGGHTRVTRSPAICPVAAS